VKHIAGPKHACRQFWTAIQHSDFVTQHPNLPRSSWDYTVPIGMHADAGAFNKQESIYVFSFNSLVGRGSTHQKRFIFTVIKKSMMRADTMTEILRVFAWSCNVLLSGLTPHQNPFGRTMDGGGEAVAGPWRAALCQFVVIGLSTRSASTFLNGTQQWQCVSVVARQILLHTYLGRILRRMLGGAIRCGLMTLIWRTLLLRGSQFRFCFLLPSAFAWS
jgi:hypothetical protein